MEKINTQLFLVIKHANESNNFSSEHRQCICTPPLSLLLTYIACKKAAKKAKAIAAAASSGSASNASSSQSEPEADTVVLDEEPSLARMPPEMGSSPEFHALVAARCARPWVASHIFETDVPSLHRASIWRAKNWPPKERAAYDKMI